MSDTASHRVSVLFRAELMPVSEMSGDEYSIRLEGIRAALEAQVTQFGLETLTTPAGHTVAHLRDEHIALEAAGSVTGQYVETVISQFFVMFRTASEAEVAEKMKGLQARKPDGTDYAGVAWQFFDAATYIEAINSQGN